MFYLIQITINLMTDFDTLAQVSVRFARFRSLYCHFLTGLVWITDKPEITGLPPRVAKIEGKNVTLSCYATGNPAPAISWTRDGSPVDTSNNSRISFSDDKKKLTITNVNRTDSGEYRCVANNSLGTTFSAATLDVQCKYSI